MSGFPGPHGYSEFARRQPERDREEARQDVPPVPRTPDADDFIDALFLRATLVRGGCDKTERTAHMLERAAEIILELTRKGANDK
jgi:hypothetical protein